MKQKLFNIIDTVAHSFNGGKKGASAKKLTSFVIVICIVVLHIEYLRFFDIHYLLEVLAADMAFVLTLFGIGTVEKVRNVAPKNDEI